MGNRFREALASGKKLLGTHVFLTDYRTCEMIGKLGFDYIWIDMEHAPTDFHTVKQHMIGTRAGGNAATLVRVTWNDIPSIKRVIEMGPDAIVVPMVNSAEEARRAIDTCIYPPEGKRGFGPSRAVAYGLDDVNEYIEKGHKEMVRLVMIESEDAVNDLEEMCTIPYLDGFIIGPMDMSGSVGELGHALTGKRTNELIDRAVKIAHENGKPIGLSIGTTKPDELAHWINKGLDFISSSSDISSVITGAQNVLNTLQSLVK